MLKPMTANGPQTGYLYKQDWHKGWTVSADDFRGFVECFIFLYGKAEELTFSLTSLDVVVVEEGRLAAEAGRLVPAVGVGALGMGVFLLRVAEVVVVEVGVGVGRLGAATALDTVLGRGLVELGLVAPDCMDGHQTQQMESKRVTKE